MGFQEWNIKADLHIINGSVEIAPNIGLSAQIELGCFALSFLESLSRGWV
jgi:hypothetical protein